MSRRSPTPSQRAEARVYRRAAEFLFKPEPRMNWGACDAISQIAKGEPCATTKERDKFTEYFKPEHKVPCSLYWGSAWGDDGSLFAAPEIHLCRTLALCFMAAMVEAGDA